MGSVETPELDTKRLNREVKLRHFQNINTSNVTNALNMMLTLDVGLTAFGVNLLVNEKEPIDLLATRLLVTSLILLIADTGVGVYLLFNRIRDVGHTIDAVHMQIQNPDVVFDKVADDARTLKARADTANRNTRIFLLLLLPTLFLLGFLCMGVSIGISQWSKFL